MALRGLWWAESWIRKQKPIVRGDPEPHCTNTPIGTFRLMGTLLFSPEADQQLVALRADARLSELVERVNDVLDDIEDDPGGGSVRRRRYQRTRVWGVPVHGSGEDWLVLWSEQDHGPLLHYIGPDLA